MTNNGITSIKPISGRKVTTEDLCLALLADAGARVGSMQIDTDGDKDYGVGWEWFNPEQVTDPENLPELWKTLFFCHK